MLFSTIFSAWDLWIYLTWQEISSLAGGSLYLQYSPINRGHHNASSMPLFLCSAVGIWHLGWAKNGDIAFMNNASCIAVSY
jgi:hypothetical protein